MLGLAISTMLWSQSQFNMAPWFEGAIQLNSDHVIKGKIHYNPMLNIVVCQSSNQLKAYSAFSVEQFSFFDDGLNINRTFKTYNFDDYYKYGNRQFMEEIISGHLIFLRKKRKEVNPLGMKSVVFQKEEDYVKSAETYNYFMMKENQLVKVKNFRKQIKKLTRNAGEEFQKFIKALDLNKVYNQARAINYYNHLMSQSATSE